MNTVRRRIVHTSSLLGVLAVCALVGGFHQAVPVSAQGGSIPLRGGGVSVQPTPDQEAGTRVLRAPSTELFRVSTHWAEAGSTVRLSSSPNGVTWQLLTNFDPEQPGVSAQESQVAVNEAGDIAIAYRVVEARPKIKHIRVALSTDAGKTWTRSNEDVDLSGAPFSPEIAWGTGRTLVVAWLDEGPEGRRRFDLYTRRSPDGGATWERPILMTGEREDGLSYTPRLVGNGKGQFWLVWIDSRGGYSTLRLTRSEDDGRTWSPSVPVTDPSQLAFAHSLAVSANNRLLLTWQDRRFDKPEPATRVYARSSKDGGTTWSAIVEVDGLSPTTKTQAITPSSALTAEGEAWIAWSDNRNGRYDVFVAHSRDGGVTWGPPQRADADGAGVAESLRPELAVSPDGKLVAVVWDDDRNGLEAIYGRVFSAGQWSAEIRLGPALPPKTAARNPLIVPAGKDAFYISWALWDNAQGGRPVRRRDDTVLRVQ